MAIAVTVNSISALAVVLGVAFIAIVTGLVCECCPPAAAREAREQQQQQKSGRSLASSMNQSDDEHGNESKVESGSASITPKTERMLYAIVSQDSLQGDASDGASQVESKNC